MGTASRWALCPIWVSNLSCRSHNDNYTRWKSAPFQVRTNSESLSEPLQPGVRFFHHPIPASPTASLMGYLPTSMFCCWRRIGLTTFPLIPTRRPAVTCWLGPIFPPVALMTTYSQNPQEYPTTYHFGLGAMLQAAFAYLYLRGFRRWFTLHCPCSTHLAP